MYDKKYVKNSTKNKPEFSQFDRQFFLDFQFRSFRVKVDFLFGPIPFPFPVCVGARLKCVAFGCNYFGPFRHAADACRPLRRRFFKKDQNSVQNLAP